MNSLARNFDTDIGPYLDRMQNAGSRICGSVADVSAAVRQIKARPSWATLSEKELRQAERLLADVLNQVRDAIADYAALPVEKV